jgi:hypothetical protein
MHAGFVYILIWQKVLGADPPLVAAGRRGMRKHEIPSFLVLSQSCLPLSLSILYDIAAPRADFQPNRARSLRCGCSQHVAEPNLCCHMGDTRLGDRYTSSPTVSD